MLFAFCRAPESEPLNRWPLAKAAAAQAQFRGPPPHATHQRMQRQDVHDMKHWAELQGKNAENAAINGVQPSNIVNVEVQEMNAGKDEKDDMSPGVPTPSVRQASAAIPWYMYMIAATASLNSIDYGFDVGVSSGVALYLREGFELGDVEVGMFFSIVPIAAALGSHGCPVCFRPLRPKRQLPGHTVRRHCGSSALRLSR